MKDNLYQHQKEIIDADQKKCGLFLGTGSGKTRIALELAKGNVLVIAPKTQVEDGNWEREMKSFSILSLTVISKETFRRDHAKLSRFDTFIIDECHTILGVTPNIRQRNRVIIPKSSQLFEAVQEYINRTKPERLYLCTATPIRTPMTVLAAGWLLGKKWDFYTWRNTFYIKLPMPGREVWSPKQDSETKNRLAQAVQSLGYTGQLSDYFDVPEQTYITKYIELTPTQKTRIKELSIEYPDPLVLLGKKHQLENGILAGNEFMGAEHFVNGKEEKVLEFALEFPKIIIFAKYIEQIYDLQEVLEQEGYRVLTMMGSTKDRGEVIKEANSLDKCVFICQAQISSGWELPDFPVMIFASMSYSIVDRIQAEGRILRANKLKKNLYIDLVVKGGIDEAVAKAIKEKKDFSERIYLNI